MAGAGIRLRRAARLVVLDDRDRVLLFEGIDPADRARGSWWFTPGGGIDDGESVEDAARRELLEETGVRFTGDLGAPVWTQRFTFSFAGDRIHQEEHFFWLRLPAFDVDTAGFNDLERRYTLGHRWWPVDELRTTKEAVYPDRLGELVADLLRDGPPPAPRVIGGARPHPTAE